MLIWKDPSYGRKARNQDKNLQKALNSPYLNVFVKFILQNKMNCSLSPE
jgi:hypothetical protein